MRAQHPDIDLQVSDPLTLTKLPIGQFTESNMFVKYYDVYIILYLCRDEGVMSFVRYLNHHCADIRFDVLTIYKEK